MVSASPFMSTFISRVFFHFCIRWVAALPTLVKLNVPSFHLFPFGTLWGIPWESVEEFKKRCRFVNFNSGVSSIESCSLILLFLLFPHLPIVYSMTVELTFWSDGVWDNVWMSWPPFSWRAIKYFGASKSLSTSVVGYCSAQSGRRLR